MEPSRLKLQRIMPSFVSSCPDLPAIFESLNDDTLTTVLQFVGNKSYKSFGGLNKQCREVYLNTNRMTKETFLYGYGTLPVILNRIERAKIRIATPFNFMDMKLFYSVGKGVVLYNRRDVLEWAFKERNKSVLKGICEVAVGEEKFDILEEVWNNMEGNKRYTIFRDLFRVSVRVNDSERYAIFRDLHEYAALHGKLDVLKWLDMKGLLLIDGERCATKAARGGQLHILEWLQKVKCLELDSKLYECAIDGDQLHVLKWLREKGVNWSIFTFREAAQKGNLDILQWLHDEGCPWPVLIRIYEYPLEPEAREWLIANGYGDRIRS